MYGIDLSDFILRFVLRYVVGDSDTHLKNFSLIETDSRSNESDTQSHIHAR